MFTHHQTRIIHSLEKVRHPQELISHLCRTSYSGAAPPRGFLRPTDQVLRCHARDDCPATVLWVLKTHYH